MFISAASFKPRLHVKLTLMTIDTLAALAAAFKAANVDGSAEEESPSRCVRSAKLASSSPPDQELFSAMYIDFMGTDAALFRSLSRRNAVRTDQHNSKWLSGEDSRLSHPPHPPPPLTCPRCPFQSRSSWTPT